MAQKVTPISSYLKGNNSNYILGERVCYLDFFLFETIELLDFLTESQVYTDYPEFGSLNQNVRGLIQAFFDKND